MLAIVVYKSGGFPSEMTWPAVTTLFGVQAWGLSDQYYFNFPAWSVSGELAAYLLFPVFAYLWRKKINLLLVAALVAGSYLSLYITHGELDLDERLMGIRAPLGFLLGMLVYSYKGWAEQIGRLSFAQAVTIAACIAIFAFGLTDYLLIPLLALLVLLTWQDKGLLSAALNNRVFRSLGVWSYGIYLLHIPVRSAANFVRPHFFIGEYEYIALLVALTVLASWLSFKYFETPMRRAVRDRLMSRSVKPVVPANA